MPDFEMPVSEQELLEIARVLCFALGGTVKDEEEEEEDLLLHDQQNWRERCLLRFGAQGLYCWHGQARGMVEQYRNLDVHSEDEKLLLRVDREDLAVEPELELPWLVQLEQVAGVTRDQMYVEREGDELVAHQHWSPHLAFDYLPVHMKPVPDPSVEVPALRLHGLCYYRHLDYHLVHDRRP